MPPPGARVVVPLGSRVVTGCIVGQAPGTAAARTDLKELLQQIDVDALIPLAVLKLAQWASDYYLCGPGEVIAAGLPPAAKGEDNRDVRLSPAGVRLLSQGGARGRRKAILDALGTDGGQRRETLLRLLGRQGRGGASGRQTAKRSAWTAALSAMAADGLLEMGRPAAARADRFRTIREWRITAEGDAASTAHAGPRPGRRSLGRRQREALDALRGVPGWIDQPTFSRRGVSAVTLSRLRQLGWVTGRERRRERDPFASSGAASPGSIGAVVLTAEQQAAVDRLASALQPSRFQVALLHGVTGSGKTEIYLRLAAEAQRAGRRVLVLVPEIGLTPATATAFRSVFGDRVAIQHSGLSTGERHDQWHRIREGEVDVVVGTRSAVFAPVSDLGLIVVDEEHDGSFKQEEAPRYHGRDVAIMRGKDAGALVVLGSATPSLESYHQAQRGRYELIRLTRRPAGQSLPGVRVVDMKAEFAERGPDTVLSQVLETAVGARVEQRQQVLVLLNRRGFAAAVFCRNCGSTGECPNCSVSLTVHLAAKRMRCHYCGHSRPVPATCSACGGTYLEQAGFGTERVEQEVRRCVPAARVARMDRDTVRRRGAVEMLLGQFARREIDVLVGTQMIAKGHDFPDVTLVGVVSADVGLGVAEFRAAERTFQLLMQVAGRAGRGDRPGETIVQTLHPGHYSIEHACRQDFDAFYREELGFRRTMRYPPSTFLVNLIVRGATQGAAMADGANLATHLRARLEDGWVLGPAPAALGRLKGAHRVQVLLKGARRTTLRRAVSAALAALPGIERRVSVDVDPVSVR